MKRYYITFRSVTFAQRAQRLLQNSGQRCSIRRTPRWMEAQGCGYSLVFSGNAPEKAVKILENAGISWRKLYIQRENGDLEEVPV